MRDLYTTATAAEYLDLSVSTIKYHLYTSGLLKADAHLGHTLVFFKETLDAFAEQERPTGRPPKTIVAESETT